MSFSISFLGATVYFNKGWPTDFCIDSEKTCYNLSQPQAEAGAEQKVDPPKVEAKADLKAERSYWSNALFGNSRVTGCGSDNGSGSPVGGNGINITPDASPSGPDAAPGTQALKLSPAQIIPLDGTGDRYLEHPLAVISVNNLYAEGLKDIKTLYLEVESDSKLVDDSLQCLPGMINVSANDFVNVAKQDFARLPVTVKSYKIVDKLTGKEYLPPANYTPQAVSAVCLDQDKGGIVGQSGEPFQIPIDPALYYYNRLDLNISITIEVDASNAVAGSDYMYFLRTMLRAE